MERCGSHHQLFLLTNTHIYICICICFLISLLSLISLFIPAAVSWRSENHFGFCPKPELERRCGNPRRRKEGRKEKETEEGRSEKTGEPACATWLSTIHESKLGDRGAPTFCARNLGDTAAVAPKREGNREPKPTAEDFARKDTHSCGWVCKKTA